MDQRYYHLANKVGERRFLYLSVLTSFIFKLNIPKPSLKTERFSLSYLYFFIFIEKLFMSLLQSRSKRVGQKAMVKLTCPWNNYNGQRKDTIIFIPRVKVACP